MSLIRKIRRRGVLHSLETLFNRIVPAWVFRFSVGVVMELDLERLASEFKSHEADEFTTERVVDAAARQTLRTTTWNSVPLEFSQDDYGYAIKRVGEPNRILGGVWAGKDDFAEANLGFQLELDPDQAWLYCAYVDRQARGVGAYSRVLSFAASDLRELGYRQLLVVIQPWNKASMHVHRKYETRTVGRIAVVRIGPIAWVVKSGAIAKDKTIACVPCGQAVTIHFPAA